MTIILDGARIRDEIAEDLKYRSTLLKMPFTLAIIQVGNLPESNRYIKQKKIFGERIGAKVLHSEFPSDVKESEILQKIHELNNDKNIDGIIIQLPLPESINREKVLNSINPKKDVDGQTEENIHALEKNTDGIIPATTRGIILLLQKYNIPIKDKNIVVIGRSKLVGAPTAQVFRNLGALVEVCHSKTLHTEEIARKADILISATGIRGLVTESFINPHQVVVDVGINVSKEGKLSGDVDFENVKNKVAFISPVPGGVGPMTISGLFLNLFETRD